MKYPILLLECLIHSKIMSELYNIFNSLDKQNKTNGFIVSEIPNLKNHKIGFTIEGYPVFFIKSQYTEKKVINKSLEIIKIEFNKECALYTNDLKEIGYYTLITLKSSTPEIQNYFLDIIYLSIQRISEVPTAEEVVTELNSLIILFSDFSKAPKKTVQGVWAEMIVIENSKDVDYLVKSWHSSIFSKFDFNDGFDKIEVKSTIKDRRIHRFSILQLSKNFSSNVLIASIMTAEVGIGSNIFDIREIIFTKLKDKNLISKVDEILIKTLGSNLDKSADCFFDYHTAVDSLKFYKSESIPNIDSSIPTEITNITFDCDLSEINSLETITYQSKLLNSL
jgi:hypothetical protein